MIRSEHIESFSSAFSFKAAEDVFDSLKIELMRLWIYALSTAEF